MMRGGNWKPTGKQNMLQGKLNTLLGDRRPEDPERALRFKDFDTLLGSRAVQNVVARIIDNGIGRRIRNVETELGQITTDQSFAASYSIADTGVTVDYLPGNLLTVAEVTVSGFSAGTFTCQFTGYADNLHRFDSFGTIIMRVNGTETARQRVGVDVTGQPSRWAIPFSVPGIFVGTASSFTVQVLALTQSPADPSLGSGGFFLRECKLQVFGGVA